MVAMSDFSTFSQITWERMEVSWGVVDGSCGVKDGLTGMRSEYFWRMRSASALRFSKGCSSLNLERIVMVLAVEVVVKAKMWFEGDLRSIVCCVAVVGLFDVGREGRLGEEKVKYRTRRQPRVSSQRAATGFALGRIRT
jgi:hypothetical protein